MISRLIDKSMYRKMPWANGGGVTTELYACYGDQAERFLWRLSIAGVAADGPFSHFERYDRILTLLDGNGLVLRHEDGREHCLRSEYEFAAFPGDIKTTAALLDGPIRDFNVITDRDAISATVTIARTVRKWTLDEPTDVFAIYAASGDQQITVPDGSALIVPQGDLLLIDQPELGQWSVSGQAAIIIRVRFNAEH
jgi:uncharacterized protein